VCAQVGNQRSRGVVIARVRTDAVRSLHHQRRDLHQSTYPVPLGRLELILLSPLIGLIPVLDPLADGSHLMRVRGLVDRPPWTRSMDRGPIPPNFL
jgi:hypothetical protein